MLYRCTVLLDTDERTEEKVNDGNKTGITYYPGDTWETDYWNVVSELAAWVKTPTGNYTAQRYPRPNSTLPKVYVRVDVIEEHPPEEDDNEIIIVKETNGESVEIRNEPTETSYIVKSLMPYTSVDVYGHVIPDIDKPIYGDKWYQLADMSGFIPASKFVRPPDIRVTNIVYVYGDGSISVEEHE